MEKLKAWWVGTAWPFIKNWTVLLAKEWWTDLGEKARPHIVSMVIGMLLYIALKLAVRLAA